MGFIDLDWTVLDWTGLDWVEWGGGLGRHAVKLGVERRQVELRIDRCGWCPDWAEAVRLSVARLSCPHPHYHAPALCYACQASEGEKYAYS